MLFTELALLLNALVLTYSAHSPGWTSLMLSFWLLTPPVLADLWLGQFSLVTAILIYWAVRAWGLDRTAAGGRSSQVPSRVQSAVGAAFGAVCWGLAFCLKGMPLLYLVFLGRARPALRFLWWPVGLLVATTCGYFLATPGEFPQFLGTNLDPAATWAGSVNIGAWHVLERGLLGRLSVPAERVAAAVFAGLIVIVAAWAGRRVPGRFLIWRSLIWHVGLWTAAFLLAFRDVWIHHYCLLLPFASVLMARQAEGQAEGQTPGRERTFSVAALVLTGWALLPNPFQAGDSPWSGAIGPEQLWRPLPTVLLFALCVVVLRSQVCDEGLRAVV